jgi:Filamin/ABP280 repeat
MRPYVKAYFQHCRAQGAGLSGSIAGVGTQFSIEAYDFRGEHRVNGNDKFASSLRKKPVEDDFLADMDEWTQKVIIKDNEDGSYHAFYNCKV